MLRSLAVVSLSTAAVSAVWWISPSFPGAKIEMARVDLKIVDTAALGSTVSSKGLTPSFLRLQCGAPLVVSAFCARVVFGLASYPPPPPCHFVF